MKLKDSNIFKIKKYVKVHSCSLDVLNRDHRQAKSWVVGELIKSKFKGVGRLYKPRDIIEDMRQDYGINMSYEKHGALEKMCMNECAGVLKSHIIYCLDMVKLSNLQM